MKRWLLIVTVLLCSQITYATYGNNLIGVGPVTRAMGGTGIAANFGPETALKNAAFVSTKDKLELSFAATYFMPDVSANNADAANIGQTPKKTDSEADTFLIPAIGLTYKLNEKTHFGLGAYGVSGLGVDYRKTRENNGLFGLHTAAQIMKFIPTISYEYNDFRFGIGLPITYGKLSIAYYTEPDRDPVGSDRTASYVSPGSSDDTAISLHLGAGWVAPTIPLNIGVSYYAATELEYDYQLTEAAADFGVSSQITSNKLTQPEEIGLGVAYYPGRFLVTFDYKQIKWSDADGFEQFGWEDQDILAFGFAYQINDKTTIRLGYSTTESPMGSKAVKNDSTYGSSRAALNFLNNVGFPATFEQHYTVGASHTFSNRFHADFAIVHAPEETTSAEFEGGPSTGAMTLTTEHSQTSYSLAGRWTF